MPKCSAPTFYGRCRKCDACLATRLRSWLLRMILEAMLYDDSEVTFVTFTYDNQHLPPDSDTAKLQFQKFLKRLRKAFNLPRHLRYVAALEQGETTARYHWHAILYGLRFSSVNRHFLHHAWGQGFIQWKPATAGRMAYVLKYVIKGGKFLMSRRPGLGNGMIHSINLALSKLSKEELLKLAHARDMSYAVNKFVIQNRFDPMTGKFGHEEIKEKIGTQFHQKSKTIQALRVGGFYYPLHDFLKKRLINLRLQHEQKQKEKKS